MSQMNEAPNDAFNWYTYMIWEPVSLDVSLDLLNTHDLESNFASRV